MKGSCTSRFSKHLFLSLYTPRTEFCFFTPVLHSHETKIISFIIIMFSRSLFFPTTTSNYYYLCRVSCSHLYFAIVSVEIKMRNALLRDSFEMPEHNTFG